MKRDMATPLARQQAVIDTVSFRERRRFETQRHQRTQRGKLESCSFLYLESVSFRRFEVIAPLIPLALELASWGWGGRG